MKGETPCRHDMSSAPILTLYLSVCFSLSGEVLIYTVAGSGIYAVSAPGVVVWTSGHGSRSAARGSKCLDMDVTFFRISEDMSDFGPG